MKHFRLVLALSLALEILGALMLVFLSPLDVDGSETLVLPAGSDIYADVMVDMRGGGPIEGQYTSTSGRAVLFMILDEGQFEDFAAGRAYGSRVSQVASAGSFSIEQVDMEKCYFVVTYADEPTVYEEVAVNYTLHSRNWGYTIGGVALMMGGAAIGAVAFLTKIREKKAVRGPLSPYMDVILFDEEHKK